MLPLKQYIKRPSLIFLGLVQKKMNFIFPDKLYLKIMYRLRTGRRLNLKEPQRFSEKLQWLKLYDRKPIYTRMVDKITAKDYVADIIGQEYIIPTLGVWDKFDDIEFDKLPDKFVLKTNHSGGKSGVVICDDKSSFDKEAAKQKLENSLKQDVYHLLREWPYKNIRPQILAEKMLEDDGEYGLMDYKIFCCNGQPKCIKVNYNVSTDYHVNWYTMNWDYIKGTTIFDPTDPSVVIKKPDKLDDLIRLAKKLSENIPFVRVDFYINSDKLYFGELTFYPGSGFEIFEPDSFDYEIGSWIVMPQVNEGK